MPSEFLPPTTFSESNKIFDISKIANTPELNVHFLQDFRLRVTSLLQTTLEIEKLIGIFFEELQTVINLTGVRFQYSAFNIKLALGRQTRQACQYQLSANGEFFGEITFCRSARFSENELENIESLMDLLLYPLRNALRYCQAVQNALTDPLTGANNRMAMNANLNRDIELSKRYNSKLAVLMIDIDNFKEVNDTFGHLQGDDVLKQTAHIIMDQIRTTDVCYRYGGEEFLVMLSKTDLDQALFVAERIREKIANSQFLGKQNKAVTVSIGAAKYESSMDATAFIDMADQSLYCAKNNGRNQTICNQRPNPNKKTMVQ
ncbi:GGDEF domain-containing protein [Marinicellulosiphila megalodicopiae]|uniref:GGDEF domain-containing protein n=1 Tax=Marinicellulosiphila megalodicopiae TaxID=2724896 RepID=UPI003BB1950B